MWFAHVAGGAELKSWSSKEPVLGVNASLTYLLTPVDGF